MKNSISPITIALVFFQLIIVVFLVAAIGRSLNNRTAEVNIRNENSQQIQVINKDKKTKIDFDDQEWDSLKEIIYNTIVEQNSQNKSIMNNITIEIRNGSIIKKFYKDQNFYYYNFIVDIPDLESSYKVKIDYAKDKDNKYISSDDARAVTCLENNDKIKYKDQVCKMPEIALDKFGVLSMYYQYEDFGGLSVYPSRENPREVIIDMTNSDMTYEEATTYVKKWIESMGYSADGFIFNYSG